MRRPLVLLALIAATLAGSGVWPPRFYAAFPARAEYGSIGLSEEPIEVQDFSATIAGVTVADLGSEWSSRVDTGWIDGDAIVLAWVGGACESRVRIFLTPEDQDLRAHIHAEPTLLGLFGCAAIGIGRAVRMPLRHPGQPPAQILVTQDGR